MKTIRLLNHDQPAKCDDEDYEMLMEFGAWSFAWNDKYQQKRVVCTLEDGSEIDMAELVVAAHKHGREPILEKLRAMRREHRQLSAKDFLGDARS